MNRRNFLWSFHGLHLHIMRVMSKRKSVLKACMALAAVAVLPYIFYFRWFLRLESPFMLRKFLGYRDLGDSSLYLVNTKACAIPKTPELPSYFQNNWKVDDIPECDYEVRNFILTDDEKVLTFLPRKYNEQCCMRQISGTSKGNYNLSACVYNDGESVSMENVEMFTVVCNSSINFEATLPLKESVQKKIDQWKNTKIKPPNVLLLGIDSVSRLHARRSLPATMKILTEMNFVEMKGYHSAGPSTLQNFFPLLMGASSKDARTICSENWNTSYDSCPFIWKLFNQHGYLTNYLEDGMGSFYWGGQGGFDVPPTDYFIRPLFQALKKMRENSFGPNATWMTREIFTNCVSTETVPQFLLRYTKKFIRKFSALAPIFSFTWMAYPFHDRIHSLPTIDEDLVEMFQWFRNNPAFLENTLIIFFSDHGDRNSEFQSESVEAFIERSLPPLFIRIPKSISQGFPAAMKNAMVNADQLTTPWDIHHTLMHISQHFLHLSDSFAPVLPDRASLFERVPRHRSCASGNIPKKVCVCDTEVNDILENASTLIKKIVNFVSSELNGIVKNSTYRNVCHEWEVRSENLLSLRLLKRGRDASEYLVVFSADPGDARFEARLAIVNSEVSKTDSSGISVRGNLFRVSKYGDQSRCVGFVTDFDKEMKQFCYCK